MLECKDINIISVSYTHLDSEDIPDYLKEVMETLPWIRVSKILSESLDELVDDLTVFIFELRSEEHTSELQ